MARVVTEKEKPFLAKVFSFLFLLLLLAIIAACLLFFITIVGMSKKQLVLDDPDKCSATPSTGAAQHLSFSEDGYMTVTFDKNDIWFFIENKEPEYREKLENLGKRFGFEYSACGFDISENAVDINFEYYRGFIRTAFTVVCEAEYDGQAIVVQPKTLRVLSLEFPIDKTIGFLNGGKTITWSYAPELTYISELTEFKLGDNTVSFSGRLKTDFIDKAAISEENIRLLSLGYDTAGYFSSARLNFSENPVECFSGVLSQMVVSPEVFTTLLSQTYALYEGPVPELDKINCGMAMRWYPDYPVEGYGSKLDSINTELSLVKEYLGDIAGKISSAYCEGKLTISRSKLYFEKSQYNVRDFFGVSYSLINQKLDLANSKLCLYYDKNVRSSSWPVLTDLCDKLDSFYGYGKDLDVSYAPGLLIHGNDGNRYTVVCDGDRSFRVLALDATVFDEMMGAEKPVIINMPAIEAVAVENAAG